MIPLLAPVLALAKPALAVITPARIWLALKILAALLVAAALFSQQRQIGRLKLEIEQHKTAAAQLTIDAQRAEADFKNQVRQIELGRLDAVAEMSRQFQLEKEHADQAAATLRADLDAARVRLRGRFTCPGAVVTPGGGLPGSPAAPGRTDGGAGLLPADAEFLVRESRRCDDTIRGLQTYIKAMTARPATARPATAGKRP
ncbi:MAG: lysis system i-spanin subunit Rz [Pseudomonadota bacterium]